jgi:EAL domain-containing protein (putative c-di-GMP-specific phosphodiesterase class I)
MECTVVAEGIETEEQRRILQEFGVDYGQGYHFARPQPLSALIEKSSSQSVRMPKVFAG